MGSSQNLRAVSNGSVDGASEADEGPASERRVGAHATLLSLLDMAYGTREGAAGALGRALDVAGLADRDALPDEAGELLVFVLGPLFSVLSAEIGPRLTKALVEDFTARFDLGSEPPPSRPGSNASDAPSGPRPTMPRAVARVSLRTRSSAPAAHEKCALLVDADRVGRASLARAFMRARWRVRVVESLADMADALLESPADALLVDVHHGEAPEMVRALVAAAPRALVVVRGPEGAETRALVALAGPRAERRSREASAEELIEAVRRATEG